MNQPAQEEEVAEVKVPAMLKVRKQSGGGSKYSQVTISYSPLIVSSEGALIAITPYDYTATHFLSTHRSSTTT